jgi:hypothetical protein
MIMMREFLLQMFRFIPFPIGPGPLRALGKGSIEGVDV